MALLVNDAKVLLSVVIPTHNVRPWIRQTLDSVLRQDIAGMEIIVVDDHSEDGTADVVRARAREDTRLRCISSSVRGGGSARNVGLSESRGEYVVFCDGDDLVPDGAYAALVSSLERTGSQLAVGDYLKFRSVDTWSPTDTMAAFERPAERISLRDAPSLLLSRPCWNKAFRRDFLLEHRILFPDVPRSNDIVPIVRAYALAHAIDIIEDVVYVYRERPGGTSMTSRASGPASVLSYLSQEVECAQILRSLDDRRVDAQLAELIWERDGFHHLEQFVLQWDESVVTTPISQRVRQLIDLAGDPPPGGDTRHMLVVQLVAGGEIAAARAAARVLSHTADHLSSRAMSAQRLDDWRELLRWVDTAGVLAEKGRTDLVERISRQLQWDVDAGDVAAWHDLVNLAARVLGPRTLMYAPGAHGRDDGDDLDLAGRREISPRVTVLRGGSRFLRLHGSMTAGATPAQPVLFDGLANGRVVRPLIVRRRGEQAGRTLWVASFAVASLPLHRPLTPAMQHLEHGSVVPAEVDGALPAYRARDGLLYDRADGVTVIRRRRHWIIRGLRRVIMDAARRGRETSAVSSP